MEIWVFLWVDFNKELSNLNSIIMIIFINSGVATGVVRGAECTPDSENLPQIGEKSGKIGKKEEKIGKKRQKSGSFFHFAPPDR